MSNNISTDVLIIGAGPAGVIAAAYLHQQGFDVQVVEKQKFPRFVIGESLLPRCMDHLEALGFMDDLKKEGFQIKKGVSFTWEEKFFDFDFTEQYTEGYTWTWQVKREKFDKILVDNIINRGINVQFEHEVIGVDFSEKRKKTSIKNRQGEEYDINSKFVIDASGYGRVLPRLLDLNQASSFEARNAVFAHLKNHFQSENQRLDKGIIDTIHNDKTWMWIIPFSDGTTSIGLVGNNSEINACVENPELNYRLYLEKIETFNKIFSKIEFARSPQSLKGFSIGVKRMYGPGYVLCGNSTEFLDPVFSSGVTFAMESGIQAAKLVSKELKNENPDWEKDYTQYMKKGIDVFRSYVYGWYDGTLHNIFFADGIQQDLKDKICSVLAGYVWDESNPFVKKPTRVLKNLSKVIEINS